jgi:hypothetical protein
MSLSDPILTGAQYAKVCALVAEGNPVKAAAHIMSCHPGTSVKSAASIVFATDEAKSLPRIKLAGGLTGVADTGDRSK